MHLLISTHLIVCLSNRKYQSPHSPQRPSNIIFHSLIRHLQISLWEMVRQPFSSVCFGRGHVFLAFFAILRVFSEYQHQTYGECSNSVHYCATREMHCTPQKRWKCKSPSLMMEFYFPISIINKLPKNIERHTAHTIVS